MSWIIENGQVAVNRLACFFKHDDLKAGMEVQIARGRGLSPAKAVITRAHRVTYDKSGSIRPEDCTSDDGLPFGANCRWHGVNDQWAGCVHVRYRNGVTAIMDCTAMIRPMNNAIGRLADIVKDEA